MIILCRCTELRFVTTVKLARLGDYRGSQAISCNVSLEVGKIRINNFVSIFISIRSSTFVSLTSMYSL